MTQKLFKIKRPIALAISILFCGITLLAQTPSIQMVSDGTIICDEGKYDVSFIINQPYANDCYIDYSITANGIYLKDITNEKIEGAYFKDTDNNLKTNVDWKITIDADLLPDPQRKHVEYKYTFTLRYNENGDEKIVKCNDVLTINVWATPKPQITSPDKDDVCGFNIDLKADTRWNDISEYKWTTSSDFLTLTNANSTTCHAELKSDAERSCNVTLTETTGGTCSYTDNRTFHFKQLPEASIAPTDGSEQFICTALENDPAFTFNGEITTEGNGPFAVILSNGQEFQNMPESTITKELTMKQPGQLTITSIVDSNGCSANENGRKGTITIIDRKPPLTPPTDTIEFEGRNVYLTRELCPMDDIEASGKEYKTAFNWEIIDSFHHHGQWNNTNSDKVDKIISDESYGYTSNEDVIFLKFRTNKTGIINTKYTEWNIMDEHENCYNSIIQTISTYDEINAPNGFSPNADFKNDYLVIEGIPDNNHLTVYDAKGKIIYDKKNYRNNWNAEGIDDGYYIYIFEGEGIKTIKETLVIKRNKK